MTPFSAASYTSIITNLILQKTAKQFNSCPTLDLGTTQNVISHILNSYLMLKP